MKKSSALLQILGKNIMIILIQDTKRSDRHIICDLAINSSFVYVTVYKTIIQQICLITANFEQC